MKRLLFLLLLHSSVSFSQNNKSRFIYLGEHVIEHNKAYENTRIGGLSGITYVSKNIFYMIADDPGEYGPPRFYKVGISYSKNEGFKSVDFLNVDSLKPFTGKSFISSFDQSDTARFIYCDAEAIRYDINANQCIWSSEGYHQKGLRAQPFIFTMDTTGKFISKIATDPLFVFDASGKKGLQHNATFEALAFIPATNNIVYCSEKSLLQDIESTADSLQPIRIVMANRTSGSTLSQFVYPLENVFNNNSNGVVELLALATDSFFVLERAYDKGAGNLVRLYLATVSDKTTNVESFDSLNNKKYTFLKKELLLDFSKSGAGHIDNIEGMCWGYSLGKNKSILFVSDNNFNGSQVTQLLLFEYGK